MFNHHIHIHPYLHTIFSQITKCTETSIRVDWSPSLYKPHIHSPVLEYIVEWTPILNSMEATDKMRTHVLTSEIRSDTLYGVFPATSQAVVVYCRSLAGTVLTNIIIAVEFRS